VLLKNVIGCWHGVSLVITDFFLLLRSPSKEGRLDDLVLIARLIEEREELSGRVISLTWKEKHDFRKPKVVERLWLEA
jgi:hypothetical protein